jgi:hypothetical protein
MSKSTAQSSFSFDSPPPKPEPVDPRIEAHHKWLDANRPVFAAKEAEEARAALARARRVAERIVADTPGIVMWVREGRGRCSYMSDDLGYDPTPGPAVCFTYPGWDTVVTPMLGPVDPEDRMEEQIRRSIREAVRESLKRRSTIGVTRERPVYPRDAIRAT